MSRFSLILDADAGDNSGAKPAPSSSALAFDAAASNILFGARLDSIGAAARRSRYNISRGQEIIVLRAADDAAETLCASTMSWGFTPHWIHSPNPALQPLTIADHKLTQPYFRDAFQQRRCLIPASGFYAWQGWENGPGEPYYVRMRNRQPFLMAAVWDTCEGVDRVAMITTDANSLIAPIHERMPAIIPPAQAPAWLRGANPQQLLAPYAAEAMEIYRTSRKLFAAVDNEGAHLIEPVAAAHSGSYPRIDRIDSAVYARS